MMVARGHIMFFHYHECTPLHYDSAPHTALCCWNYSPKSSKYGLIRNCKQFPKTLRLETQTEGKYVYIYARILRITGLHGRMIGGDLSLSGCSHAWKDCKRFANNWCLIYKWAQMFPSVWVIQSMSSTRGDSTGCQLVVSWFIFL